MPLRMIEIVTSEELSEKMKEVVSHLDVVDSWRFVDDVNHKAKISLLVPLEKTQMVLDVLQSTFGERENTRILILPVEATLPEINEERKTVVLSTRKSDTGRGWSQESFEKELIKWPKGISREELYSEIEENTQLNVNFVLLVLLSTIVATVGLIKNHTTVLIGAMLIAPLLGPNLALALSTILADFELMKNAVKTNLAGLGLAILSSFIIGLIWRYGLGGSEVLFHPAVGFDSVVLALASGAAAVVSLLSGLSSILIGVMVAVALLPPACFLGIMLSLTDYHQAFTALLLLIVNIVCINLAANIVFLLKGIHPYHWYEQQKAKKAVILNIGFLLAALVILGLVIYVQF
ncbi:MAG: TIGR00341 family protein [Gammaproteobacteria bacterium]|nr:TIGR00341 family protein [Gammaproteobacteria bacterium]